MTSMIFTPRHNDWNQALWISAHYVCILLLFRYHCFNDFASATPLKSVISALRMWAAIVLSMCRRYPTFICEENHVYLSTAFQANTHQLLAQFNWEPQSLTEGSGMFHADVSRNMLEYAGTCWNMLEHAGT